MTIHSGNSQPVNGSINGRGIKHRDLTHRQLVELAADAVSGVHPVVPSLSQASKIFEGITQSELSEELKRRRGHDGHHGEDRGNGAPTDRPEQTREEARKLAHVAFSMLEKLNGLPIDVWAGAGQDRCIRHELKLALKWAKLLNSSIHFWCPDLDAGEFPSEPAGMQAVLTAQAAE